MINRKYLALIIFLFLPSMCLAETIVLKSGKKIEGKIIEKTDKYVNIDIAGVPVPYFFEDIESIDGQKPVSITKETEPLSVESNPAGSLDNKEADNKINVNLGSQKETKEEVSPLIRKLPFSTAIITYKDSGEVYNGKEIAYIDVKNHRVSHDTFVVGRLGKVSKKINQRDICDGKTLYHIDLEEKTAPSFAVKKGDAISNIFYEDMYLKYYQGQKSFLGKECKVYSSMPGKEFYFWNGILLKLESSDNPLGKLVSEAVDIKLNVPIPDDKFRVPPSIEVMTPEETKGDMERMFKEIGSLNKEK